MRRRLLCLLIASGCWLPLTLPGQAGDGKSADLDEQKLKAANVKTDGTGLLEFLRARTLSEDDRERVELLIAQQGSSSFKVRENATMELIAKGPVVLDLLRQGLNHPDPEVQRRCEKCIQKIQERDPKVELPGAAVRLLAVRQPAGAAAALLAYLPFVENEAVAEEVHAALTKVAVQDGKVEKAVVDALTDKVAVRRAAAGAVLARTALKDHAKAIKALLKDPSPVVRWHVASALVQASDRDAVPVLIDLVPDVAQQNAWQIEDILYRLADGKKTPQVSLGGDETARKKFRDGWQAWWKDNGAGVDMEALHRTPKLLGYTTVILLDEGRIRELDANNVVRWQIDGLEFPLDLQVLDKDRILIAEFHGNKVTERNFKGEIVWQRAFGGQGPDDGPQVAQRMPNGNTFIGGKYRLVEYDGTTGKEVFSYNAPGEGILKCMKLPSGEMMCLFYDGKVARLDRTGKEVSSFRVVLNTPLYGGRIHALPNGHVLIPHHGENKVVEYDPNGKEVWHVKVNQPIIATRLPNGNTLVTSMTDNRAVEFDPNGKEVWSYRQSTRVTRALRR
jgi:hypothetical protein